MDTFSPSGAGEKNVKIVSGSTVDVFMGRTKSTMTGSPIYLLNTTNQKVFRDLRYANVSNCLCIHFVY